MKRTWVRPEMTILVKKGIDESILQTCKHSTSGPTTAQEGCKDIPLECEDCVGT